MKEIDYAKEQFDYVALEKNLFDYIIETKIMNGWLPAVRFCFKYGGCGYFFMDRQYFWAKYSDLYKRSYISF